MVFMQPKISLPCSPQPGPYFDTDHKASTNCTPSPGYYVRFNIILLSTRKHFKRTLLFGFPHQKSVCLSVVACAFHLTLLDLFTPIIFGMRYRSKNSALFNFYHSSDNSYFLGPNIFLSVLFFNTTNGFPQWKSDQVSYPEITRNKTAVENVLDLLDLTRHKTLRQYCVCI